MDLRNPLEISMITTRHARTPASDTYVSPGRCIGLDDRDPRSLRARQYLAGHGIDPRYASSVYGWRFCCDGDLTLWNGACGAYGACTNRIITPVTCDGVEVGWQARLPFDPSPLRADMNIANLRWLSMPGTEWRALHLMGYDQAKEFDFCILVADPIDMARQGPPSISGLGQPMTHAQYDLIASTWGTRRGIVVMGDAGADDDVVNKTVQELSRRCACPVYALQLPVCAPRGWERDKFMQFIKDRVDGNSRGTVHDEAQVAG